MSKLRLIHWVLFILITLSVVLAVFNSVQTVDDAYISFRYARNLATGYGLVFNPGEHVEGYSNFLWIILLCPFIYLKFDPVLISKILGILGNILTIVVIYWAWQREERFLANGFKILALAGLAINPFFTYWSTKGMETACYTFLFTFSILVFLNARGRSGLWLLSILGFIALFLTRSEGFIYFPILFLCSFIFRTEVKRHILLQGMILFIVAFTGYNVWRYLYFGSLLPQTFLIKIGSEHIDLIFKLTRGKFYLWSWTIASGPILLLACVAAFLRISSIKSRLFPLYAVCSFHLVFVAAVGGDWMSQYRFMVPITPLIYYFIPYSLQLIVSGKSCRSSRVLFVIVVLFTLCAMVYPFFQGKFIRGVYSTEKERSTTLYELSQWLKIQSPTATLAIGAVGLVPYYSNLYTIDMFGLTDSLMAGGKDTFYKPGLPGHEFKDPLYVVSRQPTFLFAGRNYFKRHTAEKKVKRNKMMKQLKVPVTLYSHSFSVENNKNTVYDLEISPPVPISEINCSIDAIRRAHNLTGPAFLTIVLTNLEASTLPISLKLDFIRAKANQRIRDEPSYQISAECKHKTRTLISCSYKILLRQPFLPTKMTLSLSGEGITANIDTFFLKPRISERMPAQIQPLFPLRVSYKKHVNKKKLTENIQRTDDRIDEANLIILRDYHITQVLFETLEFAQFFERDASVLRNEWAAKGAKVR
ncbi:hypothetical protein ACFL27_17725 [candidate division CSSED10-310 bacterium]|uniref:Glycosyltransferase RgtA/B/C/D-like domain-containing protein n=1 Tax=candidate division CSSED10-310 bacterium TaxID=2855610 RepID=A0ABV6Z0Q9_UNCC1